MYCLNCSKKISDNKKYCNNLCQKEFEYEFYIIKWKLNLESGMKGKYQISNHIRRYLNHKYDNKCCLCGWSKVNPYTEISPLEIEHIDGNYLNNSETNLMLLCPNCHSLTPTYRGANRGKGRKDRKQYSLYGNPELG